MPHRRRSTAPSMRRPARSSGLILMEGVESGLGLLLPGLWRPAASLPDSCQAQTAAPSPTKIAAVWHSLPPDHRGRMVMTTLTWHQSARQAALLLLIHSRGLPPAII